MPCFDVTVPYKPFSKSIKLSKGITVWAKEKKRKTIKPNEKWRRKEEEQKKTRKWKGRSRHEEDKEKRRELRRTIEYYHIVKHRSKATMKAIIIDSLLFFFWIPSINRVKLGTLAERKEKWRTEKRRGECTREKGEKGKQKGKEREGKRKY